VGVGAYGSPEVLVLLGVGEGFHIPFDVNASRDLSIELIDGDLIKKELVPTVGRKVAWRGSLRVPDPDRRPGIPDDHLTLRQPEKRDLLLVALIRENRSDNTGFQGKNGEGRYLGKHRLVACGPLLGRRLGGHGDPGREGDLGGWEKNRPDEVEKEEEDSRDVLEEEEGPEDKKNRCRGQRPGRTSVTPEGLGLRCHA